MKQNPYLTPATFYVGIFRFVFIVSVVLCLANKLSAASISTIQSGNWNDPLIWSGGSTPALYDDVTITAGTTVTLNTPSCVAAILTVNGTLLVNSGSLGVSAAGLGMGVVIGTNGNLTIDGGNMIVGTTSLRYSTLSTTAASTSQLNVVSGSLTVNGNIAILATSWFRQTGGAITIDGNAAGVAANSVASGVVLLSIKSFNLVLTGGTIVIVDPHAATTATRVLEFVVSSGSHYNSGTGHTIQFGDGLSTDAGGYLDGFILNVAGTRRLALGNMVIKGSASGLKRKVSVYGDFGIVGNLTIDGTNAELDLSSRMVSVGGDVTNNGILNTNYGTLAFQNYLSGTASGVNKAQRLSGNGVFKNQSTSPTANFSNLTINNNNDSGVIFLGTTWNSLSSTVSDVLTFQHGLLNISGRVLTLGVSTVSPGSLSTPSGGGFAPGNTFKRWVKTDNADYNGKRFPFYFPQTGYNRDVKLSSTTNLASPGWMQVKFNEVAGTSSVSSPADVYPIGMRYNSNWVISTGGGLAVSAANDAKLEFGGYGLFPDHRLGSFYVTLANGPAPGISEWKEGYDAAKKGLSTANLSQTFYPAHTKLIYSTATGGPWESPSSWEGGVVPTCTEGAMIVAGAVVTVNATQANMALLTVKENGKLVVNGNNVTVGCTYNNSPFLCQGEFIMNAGTFTVNGNVELEDAARFTQNGGAMIIDGNNNSGIVDNVYSVYVQKPLFSCRYDKTEITLAGGELMIRDPHIVGTFYQSYAIKCGTSIAWNKIKASPNHVLRIGDGISTAVGTTAGFVIENASAKFGTVIFDAGTAPTRIVKQFSNTSYFKGDLIVKSGTYHQNALETQVGGDIRVENNGVLIANGAVRLGEIEAGDSARAQSIGVVGTGVIKNAESAPNANFNTLQCFNSSLAGVTIGALNNYTGMPGFSGTSTLALTLGKGIVTTSGSNILLVGSPNTVQGYINVGGGMSSGSTIAVCFLSSATYNPVYYGFVDAFGNSRTLSIERTSTASAGILSVKYTDGRGLSPVSIADGLYMVTDQYKGKWDIDTLGTHPTAGSYTLAITAKNAFGTLPFTSTMRITTDTGIVGTYQQPWDENIAKRSGLTLAQLTAKSFYVGLDSASVPYVSVTSGNWHNASTWNKGSVPGSSNVVAIDHLHTVSVPTGTTAYASTLVVNKSGTLNVSSANMVVSKTLENSGTFAQNAGTLTTGEYMINTEGSICNLSGPINGNIGSLGSSGYLNITGGNINLTNGFGTGPTGEFRFSGGTVNVGPAGGGKMSAYYEGTTHISGGTFNINGRLVIRPLLPSSSFNQTGGSIVVDGNANGNVSNSVQSSDHLIAIIGDSSNLHFSAGSITLVDPHAGYQGSGNAVLIDITTDVNMGLGHTFRFGKGSLSTNSSLNTAGMNVENVSYYATSAILSFGNVLIDAYGSTFNNRYVNLMTPIGVRGSMNIMWNSTFVMRTGDALLNVFGDVTNSGTFTFTNGKVVMAGSTAQTLPPIGICANVEIRNPAGVTLANSTMVNDSLILTEGKLILGASNLTLANAWFANEGTNTSYIKTNYTGAVTVQNIGQGGKTGDVVIPVGNSTYNPVTINNMGVKDHFRVRVMDSVNNQYTGDMPIGVAQTTNAVNCTWLVNDEVAGGSNITLKLGWNAADQLPGFNPSSCYIAQYRDSIWLASAASAASGATLYTQTLSGITSLQAFGVGGGGTLPVELIRFTGQPETNGARLSWATASERNNDYFELLRSTDGYIFEKVITVKGKGTTSTVSTYTYLDRDVTRFAQSAKSDKVYYRLVQVDMDGYKHTSEIISVNINPDNGKMEMFCAPNPFTETTNLYITSDKADELWVRVSDLQGKVVMEKQLPLLEGANTIALEELNEVLPGMYFITTVTNTLTQTILVVKTK